jgi:MarR family transcriptional regulator, lower aerobic nicotinate degradation pathway regulator
MGQRMTTPSQVKGGGEIDLGVVDALAQLSFLVWGLLAERASHHDLSMIQTRLLGVLRDREPSMHELARLLELDKSSVTGLIDRAEKRGLVTRTVSTEDRRAFRVSLTKLGRKLVDRVAHEFQTEVTATLAGLSDTDRTALSGLASRVVVAHAADRGIDLLDVAKPL